MKLTAHACGLQLANPWKIANTGSRAARPTIIVELTDENGLLARGEAAPSGLHGLSADDVIRELHAVDLAGLSFADPAGSRQRLEAKPDRSRAALCALDLALLDGAARRARQPLHTYLDLAFAEGRHVTSYSIGIDTPEIVGQKVAAAAEFPVLKLKVGSPDDQANFIALRRVAPEKPIRLDANEGWKTKEEALRMIEWLAALDNRIEFIEQPMPRAAALEDLRWLKARSPLPLFADESCHHAGDIPRCAEAFHGVNIKLIKAGGLTRSREALEAARRHGLKTMIGCTIETSLQISAAAHLAALADYLDLDGNLLITNDPFTGVTAGRGILSFADATDPFGIRASPRTKENS